MILCEAAVVVRVFPHAKSKQEGDAASKDVWRESGMQKTWPGLKSVGNRGIMDDGCRGSRLHAKMLWSGIRRMISSCNRRKADFPSPYRVGMLMLKIPSSEYAMSSSLVVSRIDAHESR